MRTALVPDGRYMAFASNLDGDSEIYIMRQDGGEVTKLTDNSVGDGQPDWISSYTADAVEADRTATSEANRATQMPGTLPWRYKTGHDVYSSPTVSSGVVYVGSYDNHLYAVDAATGELIWIYETGDEVYSSPTVVDGLCTWGRRTATCMR